MDFTLWFVSTVRLKISVWNISSGGQALGHGWWTEWEIFAATLEQCSLYHYVALKWCPNTSIVTINGFYILMCYWLTRMQSLNVYLGIINVTYLVFQVCCLPIFGVPSLSSAMNSADVAWGSHMMDIHYLGNPVWLPSEVCSGPRRYTFLRWYSSIGLPCIHHKFGSSCSCK